VAISSRELLITQGNIDNNHMYLTEVEDLFPEDTLGGANEDDLAPQTVRIHWGDEFVDTDIVRGKHIFRKRACVRQFFDANRVVASDVILLEQLGPYEYRVSKVSR